jgi:membrane-bound lytic murein transglycosylase D
MPVRVSALAAVVLLFSLAFPPAGLAATASPTPGSADSLARAAETSAIQDLRALYEAAWVQRQAGEYVLAVRTAEAGLTQVDKAIGSNPDAAARRELVDLRSRLDGLRSAAHRDAEIAAKPPASGSRMSDDQVLAAPAVDEIEPQFNAEVYRYIEFFTGAGRSTFERWLKRSGRYMELFRSVLRNEGMPPDLVHLVFVESGFNIHARSVSAAVGPWQFLRSTGRLFGLTVNQWVDERKDPEKSTVAAARYLRHLYGIFNDWPLALASYNAGEGTVLRAIKRQGTTNYWDLKLPRQTEEYVPQFMAVLAISRDPKRYGFDDVPLDEPMEFDEVALKGAVDLRAVAKLADCTAEEIKYLNPAVLRGAAQGRDGITTIRVPEGKGAVVIENLQNGAELPPVNLTVKHVVKRGETLSGIAARYRVSARELATENGIDKDHLLRRGQTLTVPGSMRSVATATPRLADPEDPRAATSYVPERKIGLPATIEGESDAEGRLTHRVKRGETLSQIAGTYGVSTAEIREWNHLTTSTLRRGMRLKIRRGPETPSEAEALVAAQRAAADSAKIAALKAPKSRKASGPPVAVRTTVTVRPGDTLSTIAAQHGVSISALKRANGMSGSRIRAGQKLKIPQG